MEVDVQLCNIDEFSLGINSSIGEDETGLKFQILIIGFLLFEIVITNQI